MRLHGPSLMAGLVVSSLLGGFAAADWIVTTDGERIETRGPWEVEGRLVVMTLANGELASMRLSNVDLDASRRATEEASRVVQSPLPDANDEATVQRSARIVLTDEDFTTVRRPLIDTEEEGPGEDATASTPLLVVTVSEDAQDPETGGTLISGILANRSRNTLANVELTVRLLDVEGEVLAETEAILSSPALSPGGRASFQARFPDVLAFAEVVFVPRAVELLAEGSEASPTSGATEAPSQGAPEEESPQRR